MTNDELIGHFAGAVLVEDAAVMGENDARSVVLGGGADRLDILVLRHRDRFRAYLNECPHAFTTLETFDGRFFDADDPTLLNCSTHGARFRVSDGVCVEGPCRGKRLKAIDIRMDGKTLRLGAEKRG